MFALFNELDAPIPRVATSLGGRSQFAAAGSRMRANWAAFALAGVPAAGWPGYAEDQRSTLIIDAVDRIVDDPRSLRRLAWSAFLPHLADAG
jgi:para-nitrobenzyl esterase